MTIEAMIDHAARLARSLHLENLLLNAGAVPLPVDLIPSALAQSASDRDDAVAPAASEKAEQAAAPAVAEVKVDGEPADNESPQQDAVSNALQAARDAISDSLRHDTLAASSDDSQPVHVAIANPEAGELQGDVGSHDASPQQQALDLNVQTTGSAVGAHESIMPTTSSDDVKGSLAFAMPEAVHGDGIEPSALAAVAGLAAPLTATAGEITGSLTTIAGDLAVPVTSIASEIAPVALAAVAQVSDVVENVTVSSLQGVGVDALVGMLQAAPAAEAAHAVADAAHTTLDDMAVFAPVGVDDVVHSDAGLTHTVHSALHLVGSGLI